MGTRMEMGMGMQSCGAQDEAASAAVAIPRNGFYGILMEAGDPIEGAALPELMEICSAGKGSPAAQVGGDTGDTGRRGESGAIPAGHSRSLDCFREGIVLLSEAFRALIGKRWEGKPQDIDLSLTREHWDV